MGFSYTEDQQKVIGLRNRNILVSAAAGSGKTAVLTERILSRIRDGADKLDIDRLLVVTFTNAAAAEMRERIRLKLTECLEKEPENEHLQKQTTLIHNAQITTIDSFCLFVIRNNFNDIGLDPGFRIADEGELKLMKQDVLAELLEEKFACSAEEFLYCVECYSTGSRETLLEENIMKLYEFSVSYPFPEEWLLNREADYQMESLEDLENSRLGGAALLSIRRTLQDCVESLEQALKCCEQPDGPYMYGDLCEKEAEMLRKLTGVQTLSEMEAAVEKIRFDRLPSKKDDSVSPLKRENVKRIRNRVKESLQDIKETYFFQPLTKSVEQSAACRRAVREMIGLTICFKRKFDERKREKNLIDFSDMEHFALEILVRKGENGEPVPTETAMDYRDYFKEIMIDEYQDSNLVQEYILAAVSGESIGNYNRFMVGDVKQSIYKFRLARPEIFMGKYKEYSVTDGERQRIDLHQNFRSRKEVIDSVNYIFYQIMGKDTGGITYDENAALSFGADFLPALPKECGWNDGTELLLVEKPEKGEELSAKTSEAYAVAKRIKKLLKENYVTDRETGKLRPVSYKDIVVLLRSNSGWDEEFQKVFEEEGIPSYITSKTGYFKTTEIRTLLQFLRVIDNPLQDIPLFGVMHGIFGGFSEEETALVKVLTDTGVKWGELFYHRIKYLLDGNGEKETKEEKNGQEEDAEEGREGKIDLNIGKQEARDKEELKEKLGRFYSKLERYRKMTAYLSIYELIRVILDESGYLLYVTALPGGEQRKANVEMLLEKAAAFEQTSYHGLFHFIRYMEQMEKYDVDYGEVGIYEEEADVVRMMSIHKSKGLEFPICIVAGLSKKFNMQDTTKPLIADVDMGIGTDFIDPVARIRNKTLRKNVMAEKMRLDNVAEELRILYVAMTRAKEKLILTGSIDKPLEKIGAFSTLLTHKKALLPYSAVAYAGSYMDLLLAALIRHPGMQEFLGEDGGEAEGTEALGEAPVRIRIIGTEDLVKEEVEEQVIFEGKREKLEAFRRLWETQSFGEDGGPLPEEMDAGLYADLREKFAFAYPYEDLSGLYTKTTVSELKKAGQNEELDFSVHLIEEEEIVPYIPKFIKETEKISGTTRGSAMHKIMELLDFERAADRADVLAQMEEERKAGRLSEEFYAAIRVDKVERFLKSDLCKRMRIADRTGLLYRESPFVYGIGADRLDKKFPKEETVLVQGIIDVYFEEDGALVVADYKTDAVADEKELADRYALQLDYYAEALEKLTGKPVKEKIIYSFYQERAITLGK